jgi:hypothetical protein
MQEDVVINPIFLSLAVAPAMTLWIAGGDMSGTTPPSPPSTVVDGAGCPVEDEAFCDVATEAANALAAGDDEALLGLSRVDTIDCDVVAVEYFPECDTNAVLRGYGLSDPEFLVDLVDERAYIDHLDTITGSVDPSFSDELGDGALRVIGVGTCGPDVPGRRTYHLAWTAAHRRADSDAERVLGSFEFTFADDWRIALTYMGTFAEWRTEHADPLHEAFCQAGRTPWRS